MSGSGDVKPRPSRESLALRPFQGVADVVAGGDVPDGRDSDSLVCLEKSLGAQGIHDVVFEVARARELEGDVRVEVEHPRKDPLPLGRDSRDTGRRLLAEGLDDTVSQ